MAFDQTTRNRLQRFVTEARRALEEEFTRQMQNDYGLDPVSGTASPLESLRHINDQQRETSRILRDTLAHYCASSETDTQTGLDRIVREQAFTVLNRLAALRMAEARGLLIKSVGNGYQAKGFQLYARLAGTALGETGDAYRVYLQSVFDEFALDLPSLFDRLSPQGRLFPREAVLLQVLALINHGEIEPLWAEDETIGWIYQYFNSKEERKAMREASQAPRNSRELAVRNQFFTPRYVVEFLVDNTLGRLWFNWTGGQTALRDCCQYLLLKPDEKPEAANRLRDPRTVKLLDPACGSMHFGLYAFDLFQEIYLEAWEWEQAHGPDALDRETGGSPDLKPLSETYADRQAFLRDVPRLIIELNIYGVDIDPRAAQIASLALWLRAQRAWHEAGVKAKDRPQVGQGHVVAAVAPPAEVDLRKRFMEELDPLDAELFEQTLFLLKGLPELGVLLQVEKELPALIRKVFGEHGDLFRTEDMAQWQKAEARLREALTHYAHAARSTYQGRLFAEDALQGLRIIDHCREVFDVVVMNPPFGLPTSSTKMVLTSIYPETWKDIYAAFIDRALSLLSKTGRLGAITPNMWLYSRQLRDLRIRLLKHRAPDLLVEFGGGVMDDAAVEAAMWTCPSTVSTGDLLSLDLIEADMNTRAVKIKDWALWKAHSSEEFTRIENSPYCHHMPKELLALWKRPQRLEQEATIAAGNTTFDDFRFVRLWWEVPAHDKNWVTFRSGSDFQPFYSSTQLKIDWRKDGASMRSFAIGKHGSEAQVMQSSDYWFKSGLSYPRVGTLGVGIRVAHPGEIFSGSAGFILPQKQSYQLVLAGLLNSSFVQALFKAHGRYRKTETIAFKDLPLAPSKLGPIAEKLQLSALEAVKAIIRWEGTEETSRNFSGALLSPSESETLETDVYSTVTEAVDKIDLELIGFFSLDPAYFQKPDAYSWSPLRKRDAIQFRILSYAVGLGFGRYAPVIERDSDADNILNFIRSPLPEASPAIQARGDLPAIVILVDDSSSRLDLASIVEDWMARLEVEVDHDVRTWLRKDFFSLHLQQYSQNRRNAPIYWPLSTTSGSYTLWLYYPSLTSQTLYSAVNDFIEPKLQQVGANVATLRSKGSARTRDDEKQFESLQAFELELIELRDTLLKLAPTYKPNHDDGVQISAAPLWPLFRHKPWQKVLKDTWTKLEKGDYDWAHLAMNYWPSRVREKCKTDKSLAIAQGLEDLYIEPKATPKKTRKRKDKEA